MMMFGVTAAVFGNCLIGISQFLQKLALNKLRDDGNAIPRFVQRHFTHSSPAAARAAAAVGATGAGAAGA